MCHSALPQQIPSSSSVLGDRQHDLKHENGPYFLSESGRRRSHTDMAATQRVNVRITGTHTEGSSRGTRHSLTSHLPVDVQALASLPE